MIVFCLPKNTCNKFELDRKILKRRFNFIAGFKDKYEACLSAKTNIPQNKKSKKAMFWIYQ